MFRAGLEIKLNDGWKTYWRYPGDSGVPPSLDFSKSENVKAVAVEYPAPHSFPDGAGGHSIGYKGDVVWPLRITPKDAGRPVTLKLNLDYAACEKLCLPAQARLQLTMNGKESDNEQAIAAAEAQVPRHTSIGDTASFAIRAVHREKGGDKPRIVVDVAAPGDAAVTLYAEGPTQQWALPLPEPVAGAPSNVRRFSFDLDGLPPDAKAEGSTLRLTAVAGDQSIEASFRLD